MLARPPRSPAPGIGRSVMALRVCPPRGPSLTTGLVGTTPTDLTTPVPKVGTLGNGGAIGVRFDNQTMSTLSPIQWSMPASGSSYAVSFQNASWAPTLTTRTDPETGGSNRNLTYPAFTAPGSSCGGCTNLAVSVSPTFYGKTAQGLGLAISTRATVGAHRRTHSHSPGLPTALTAFGGRNQMEERPSTFRSSLHRIRHYGRAITYHNDRWATQRWAWCESAPENPASPHQTPTRISLRSRQGLRLL